MYEAFWGLHDKPFENTPDPRFYFASNQHREACARMVYCVRERKGAGVLTGVFGCGKTVVGHLLLQELNQERYRSAYIANPRLSDIDLLRMITHYLGLPNPPSNKADVCIALESMVQDNAREGRDTVIVIDEAHVIEDAAVFQELRLLLNLQWKDRFLVTLLLIGQPELASLIDRNKAFEQRIGIKSHLQPLSQEETRDYIYYRLRVAGHARPESVFTAEAVVAIAESTGGIPRRLNRLCDICLLAGMGRREHQIDGTLVGDEVKGLAV
jgi:type II secretory pathway predicted ATPase ExeA